jgi:hypothetical protein
MRIDYAKAGMAMVGHHHGSIQVDALVVLCLNHGHHKIPCSSGELKMPMTANGHEISCSWCFQARQLAAPNNEFARFAGIEWLKITEAGGWLFLAQSSVLPVKNTG